MAKGYFEHISPQGLSPWFWFRNRATNYRYAGENLAIGFCRFRGSQQRLGWHRRPTKLIF